MVNAAPEPTLLKEIESRAVEYARGVGDILLERFQSPMGVEFKSKGGRDPVTEADKAAEGYLREAIARDFPSHGILGEEAGESDAKASPFVWVLDPLDGTNNFLNGLPLFAASIGVLWNSRPVAGSIFVPLEHGPRGSIYHASAGGPAYRDGQAISISDNPSPDSSRLFILPGGFRAGGRRRSGRGQSLGELRSLGSIALEMALCADGTLRCALFWGPRIWDVAAGALIVQRAGGALLTRHPRRGGWQPLQEFRPEPRPGENTLKGLSRWRGAVLAGDPEAVAAIAQGTASQFGLLGRLRARLRRLL